MNRARFGGVLKRGWPLVGLLLAILLFFHKMAFSNLILARGDTFLYFYPYWDVAAEALRTARIPLWNPAIFMGAPLLANSQMGFFYPLNWPVWLLLETPYALSASILLHIGIAAAGAYFVASRVALLGRTASFVTATAFALGGYLTAQVEHINQLQGLSWLPWLLLAAEGMRRADGRARLRPFFLLAFFFTLQLLAGHTQTAFISGVALVVWVTAAHLGEGGSSGQGLGARRYGWRRGVGTLLLLAGAGIVALLLAGVQVLPTLELSRLSSRQGGLPLNEVLSFSLNPLHVTRALLPAYGQSLFSEYVAMLPLSVLALAFVGAWQWRRRPGVLPAVVWLAAGLLLALGAFSPLYWLLGRLPGFDLFRVPARWLLLYAFGAALLAGVGWQTVVDYARGGEAKEGPSGATRPGKKEIVRPLVYAFLIVTLLALWAYAAAALTVVIPTGAEAPFEAPSWLTLGGWVVEAGLLVLFFWLYTRSGRQATGAWWMVFLLALILVTLFMQTRLLPYNNLTAPQAYFDLRPSTTRLMVETAEPPHRLLSLSDIFFDLGEQGEIDTIYGVQLPAPAQYDYIVAAKHKEVMSPNLPMLYDLASVDGFDGGVLPLKAYTEQMRLILPEGVITTDGRLREYLDAVPAAQWLDLFNMGFLITDKVGDVWLEGVFYDRQHPYRLQEGQQAEVAYLPEFEATEVRLLATAQPGLVEVTTGGLRWEIEARPAGVDLYIAAFPQAAVAEALRVNTCPDRATCDLLALTLVDQRDGAFQSLVAGAYRLVHSGDVKIYENLDVMPRAYAVAEWQWVGDERAMMESLRATDFDPRRSAVLLADDGPRPEPQAGAGVSEQTSVTIERYLPEEVVVTLQGDQDAMLILSDTLYPGWQAALDGVPVPIFRANNLFRAVFVPAGEHEVRFSFQPRSFYLGSWLSLASLAIVTIIMTGLLLSRRGKKA